MVPLANDQRLILLLEIYSSNVAMCYVLSGPLLQSTAECQIGPIFRPRNRNGRPDGVSHARVVVDVILVVEEPRPLT